MSSIDRTGRRATVMPMADISSTQSPQNTSSRFDANVQAQSARRTGSATAGAAFRPTTAPRLPNKFTDGGLLSALMARRRAPSRGSSNQGDRDSVEAEDFLISVPVVASQRFGNGGQSNSSDSSSQTFANVPAHAGAAAEFRKSANGASINIGAQLDRQINAAHLRLDAIAAAQSQQHLTDAVDNNCIELMEHAGRLVEGGYPAVAVMRQLTAGMSKLYERYAPNLTADFSSVVNQLKNRALTRPRTNSLSQDVPQSVRAFYAMLPPVWDLLRSGNSHLRARRAA
jgi:hypothetical protein